MTERAPSGAFFIAKRQVPEMPEIIGRTIDVAFKVSNYINNLTIVNSCVTDVTKRMFPPINCHGADTDMLDRIIFGILTAVVWLIGRTITLVFWGSLIGVLVLPGNRINCLIVCVCAWVLAHWFIYAVHSWEFDWEMRRITDLWDYQDKMQRLAAR